MEIQSATVALSALAHEGRLGIFREMVRAGPEGLAAGDLARRTGIAPNTLSASLTILSRAGLARSHRAGRSIIYRADYDQMSDLIGFLMEDCCEGRPEVCAPLAALSVMARCGQRPI
jgi:DNA-binding transcriptional ArsR family regulator